MRIKFNNEYIDIPEEAVTVSKLLEIKNVSSQGTAIALNGKLAPRAQWDNLNLKENDDIIVISAAFGG